jgi:hypothetical protein
MGLLGGSKLSRTWSLAAPPDAVWRVVADSARLNEVSGLPHYRLDETPDPDGSVTRIGTATLNGYALEWEEPAGEWVAGKWFRQERRLRRGPVRRFVTAYTIEPEGAGTRLVWRVEAEPAGWAGLALRASRFLERFADGTEGRIRMLLADAPADPPTRDASRLPEGAAAAVERLTSDGHEDADRLARYLLGAAETDLDRVRPLHLARTWPADRRRIIELCLAAVPAGLMVSRVEAERLRRLGWIDRRLRR